MAIPTLALSGLVNVGAGLAFAFVGLRFVPRRVSPSDQLAMQAFAVYWTAMGAYTALGGAMDLLASVGISPFPLFLAARLVGLPIIAMSVGAVTFYYVYLFTGDQRWVWLLSAFYATILVGMSYYIADRGPIGVVVGAWRTDIAYADPYETGILSAIVLGLALPPILGAIAYLVLVLRLPTNDSSRRARAIGIAILVWSAAAVFARVGEGSDFVQFLSRPVLGVAVAITVVRAYLPVRARAPGRTRERDELADRMQQLI